MNIIRQPLVTEKMNAAGEKLNCYGACGYFQSRKKAIASDVALLTYSYGLIQRNYVEDKSQNGSAFEKRDFVVCDEAHKVVDIVQSHFSPKLSAKTADNLLKLDLGLADIGFSNALIAVDQFREVMNSVTYEEDKESLLKLLKRSMSILGKALSYRDEVQKSAKSRFGDENVPSNWKSVFKGFDFVKDVHCKIEDYIEIIEKSGLHFMIKATKDGESTFNCLDEKYLMDKHFLKRFGFKLLMTATMGSKSEFESSIGVKKSFHKKMESTFDFSRSPIYYYPKRRMGMKRIPQQFAAVVIVLLLRSEEHTSELQSH